VKTARIARRPMYASMAGPGSPPWSRDEPGAPLVYFFQ
jgi:hypothetical protein